MGLLLKAVVHEASIPDHIGARMLLEGLAEQYPELEHLWADAGYRGTLAAWAKETLGIDIEITGPPRKGGYVAPGGEATPRPTFAIVPRRWVVERTFAWLGRYRRFARDYEELPETEVTLITIAMSRLMLARLATV